MNETLRPFISMCVVVYFDDILIYRKDITNHLEHLRSVLSKLRDEKLLANASSVHFVPKVNISW